MRESASELKLVLSEIEVKIQDMKWRCHGRFELMDLIQKKEALEERLRIMGDLSSQEKSL